MLQHQKPKWCSYFLVLIKKETQLFFDIDPLFPFFSFCVAHLALKQHTGNALRLGSQSWTPCAKYLVFQQKILTMFNVNSFRSIEHFFGSCFSYSFTKRFILHLHVLWGMKESIDFHIPFDDSKHRELIAISTKSWESEREGRELACGLELLQRLLFLREWLN